MQKQQSPRKRYGCFSAPTTIGKSFQVSCFYGEESRYYFLALQRCYLTLSFRAKKQKSYQHQLHPRQLPMEEHLTRLPLSLGTSLGSLGVEDNLFEDLIVMKKLADSNDTVQDIISTSSHMLVGLSSRESCRHWILDTQGQVSCIRF